MRTCFSCIHYYYDNFNGWHSCDLLEYVGEICDKYKSYEDELKEKKNYGND